MKLAISLLALLCASVVMAATVDVLVFGSREAQSVSYAYNWQTSRYTATTNYLVNLSVQIPFRPNGTRLDWEREISTNTSAKLTWNTVSNRVARMIAREMLDNGISTNGHIIAVRRGGKR